MSRKPSHAKRKPKGKMIAVIVVCAAIVAGIAYACIFQGDRVSSAIRPIIQELVSMASVRDETSSSEATATDANVSDTLREEGASDQNAQAVQTKQVASYGDVALYSPIPASEVTGVLFHQASYAYALVMDTQLPKADATAALEAHSVRVNRSQTDGTWLDADALHVWRTTASTAMDTSIDIGAEAGTLEYAPVTGTVVLVTEYQLYDTCTDYEIHIQPDGHPELDVVVIHDTDPLVGAGDHVVAGATPIASVRDIAASITGIQLAQYTDTAGNHAHIQINDADYEGYREKKLAGAITPES